MALVVHVFSVLKIRGRFRASTISHTVYSFKMNANVELYFITDIIIVNRLLLL